MSARPAIADGNPSPTSPQANATSSPGETRHTFLDREFRRNHRWLLNAVWRKLGNVFDAEDIASSSFVELAGHDHTTVREPRALLTTIAQRLVFDMWRRRSLERAYLQALEVAESRLVLSEEARLELSQSLLAIDRALHGVPVKAREAFLLSQIDGMTYAEIAETMGVSQSMVRKYMTRAMTTCLIATSA